MDNNNKNKMKKEDLEQIAEQFLMVVITHINYKNNQKKKYGKRNI